MAEAAPVKALGSLLAGATAPLKRWNLRFALVLLVLLALLVVGYSAIFQHLMALEGRQYGWTTSIYWTIVTMSTLGYGDIVFESPLGHVFTTVVLITGAVFILVLLPFVFIQFVFTPWMNRRESARAPRHLADDVDGHILLTALDDVTDALIERAQREGVPYVLLVPDLSAALRLHDHGYAVMVGELDDPRTYRHARADHASMVVSTRPDTTNTNVAFTVREIAPEATIVATANDPASVDVLELAGCDEVLQLGELLGRALARRVVGVDTRAHVIGEFGELRVAEANVRGTELEGRTIAEAALRPRFAVNVIGVWEGGRFTAAAPDTRLGGRSILLLAGSQAQLERYDAAFAGEAPLERPVLVIGGGRVGRAAASALEESGIRSVIVEKLHDRIRPGRTYVEGDAAELEVLRRAGLDEAAAALVTTHEDDVNVYLTLYLRRLRPDLQVIARATRDRNVSTLHRAGADAVLSYASLGATAVWNAMGRTRRLVIAEGVEMFRTPIPASIRGRSLHDVDLGRRTGCQVVALARGGELEPNPDPTLPLPHDADLVVIGDEEAEQRFHDRFVNGAR